MKSIEMDLIETTDNLGLRIAIFFWKEYDSNTVFRAYAELVKRGYPISNSLYKKMTEFRDNQLQSNN